MAEFQTTNLDFSNIKQSLKLSFQKKAEFTDYDFEASALDNILDVLALNTHYNMLGVSFGLNETFLNSAQLRSSVVSIGNYLGYNIRSATASRTNLNLTLNLSDVDITARPPIIPLPIGTTFIANSNNINYTFSTIDFYTATPDASGLYTFSLDGDTDVKVYEGTLQTKTFLVGGDSETFIIPDTNIDTKTARVLVYPTFNSTGDEVEYTDIFNAREFTDESTYYRITETPTGEYELNFGDSITGKSPVAGNRIVLTYISSSGSLGNNLLSFSLASTINGYTVAVNALTPSYGGQDRQSIDSIKYNAPLAFAQQARLVTAQDYESSVRTNYNIADIVSWGGEDNIPPQYGTVFLSVIFPKNTPAETILAQETDIRNSLNDNLGILSISVEFSPPIITYLEFNAQFGFASSSSTVDIEESIKTTINAYVVNELQTFKKSFRKSNLTTIIDGSSSSILYSDLDVKLQRRLVPINEVSGTDQSTPKNYQIQYPVSLKIPNRDATITSSTFKYNNENAKLKNRSNTNIIEIVDLENRVIRDNVGTYNATDGLIELTAFDPGEISSNETMATSVDDIIVQRKFIKITAVPANDNIITPTRNHYLDIDDVIKVSTIVE